MEWIDVTDSFDEKQRNYCGTYMEINEIFGDAQIEVSLFSSDLKPYEIYITYGYFSGIIYTDKENANRLREEIKSVIAQDYLKNKEPSDEFIDELVKKYNIEFPDNLFFDYPNDDYKLFFGI